MAKNKLKIGVAAPANRIDENLAARLAAFAGEHFPSSELVVHPQCFLSHGHFAGNDDARAKAFLEIANDESFDALWWARGGYGSNRIAPLVLPKLTAAAKKKTYLGYSDAGFLLAGLYKAGFPHVAHGPVARDIARDGGEAAAGRALSFLINGDPATLEAHVTKGEPRAAFNLCVLSHIVGTALEPDLSGHVLMLEDVSEQLYRIDRALWHVTSAPAMRKLAGIRMGRFTDILPNDPEFGQSAEQIARHWCDVSGIPYLGSADIGHDIGNTVVPFGK